jgi:hypothetical protein
MTVLFLCRPRDLDRERLGYARAFARLGIPVGCAPEGAKSDVDLREILASTSHKPSLVIQGEGYPMLPRGLTTCGIPTVSFQIDTYTYPHRRARWSLLFDYVALFHPGFEALFRAAGHPRPLLLPHAIDAEAFSGGDLDRIFEIGWVGRLDGPLYEARRRVLPRLAERFRMNEWRKHHSPAQMIEVYRRSKLVVNIARDDYPQDANLRVFEAMAAGALLLTRVPSELTALGFEEGVDFLGYRDESELLEVARWALASDSERTCIAESGRAKVLHHHTYDRRVETLLRAIGDDHGSLPAPARLWPARQVREAYLDYWLGHTQLQAALSETLRIAVRHPGAGANAAARFARACLWHYHHVRSRTARGKVETTPSPRQGVRSAVEA